MTPPTYTARGAGHTHRSVADLLWCGVCCPAVEHEVDHGVHCVDVVDRGIRRLYAVELAELAILIAGDGPAAA